LKIGVLLGEEPEERLGRGKDLWGGDIYFRRGVRRKRKNKLDDFESPSHPDQRIDRDLHTKCDLDVRVRKHRQKEKK